MTDIKANCFGFSMENNPSARKENPLQHCVIQVEDVFMNPCDAQADKSAEKGRWIGGVSQPVFFKIT